MAELPLVVLPQLFGGQADSWAALVDLAPAFGDNWLLVGGQMVFLHQVEQGARDLRPTDDVDVVVDLRAEPGGLARIHVSLRSAGFDQDDPSPEGTAHRYRRGDAVIDVLAPNNVGKRAQLELGSGRTIEAPGTSQAFHRSGLVVVDCNGATARIRRPNLVGALLGKAAAVVKITSQSSASRAKHLRDFDSLARMMGPNDRATADLNKGEKRPLGGLSESARISDLGGTALAALARVGFTISASTGRVGSHVQRIVSQTAAVEFVAWSVVPMSSVCAECTKNSHHWTDWTALPGRSERKMPYSGAPDGRKDTRQHELN